MTAATAGGSTGDPDDAPDDPTRGPRSQATAKADQEKARVSWVSG